MPTIFETCRRKRNVIDYTRSHVATDSESDKIVTKAREFYDVVEAWIESKFPHLTRCVRHWPSSLRQVTSGCREKQLDDIPCCAVCNGFPEQENGPGIDNFSPFFATLVGIGCRVMATARCCRTECATAATLEDVPHNTIALFAVHRCDAKPSCAQSFLKVSR
jgi:hypothetical protein